MKSGTTLIDNVSYLRVLSNHRTSFTLNASDDGVVTYNLEEGTNFATLTVDSQDQSKAEVAVELSGPDPQHLT